MLVRKHFKLIVFILLLSSTSAVNSQTDQERYLISSQYDADNIIRVSKKVEKYTDQVNQRLKKYLLSDSTFLNKRTKDNIIYQVKDILKDGSILYHSTYNDGASKTIRANRLYSNGNLGLDINGEGMIAGIWEVELPNIAHQEFQDGEGNSKINLQNKDGNISYHATHVTGTIIASGIDEKARGIAPKARSINFDWVDDKAEMNHFGSEGYLVSNHSYGNYAEALPQWMFGAYDEEAALVDEIAYAYPKYQIVKAVGNDKAMGQYLNPEKDGYGLTTGFSNSKNVLSVGAVNQLLNYRGPETVVLSNTSNIGPTHDGRIKPNIVAKGVNVYSSSSESNDAYKSLNGTSMAAPGITGSILLLQQHYNNLHKQYMNSATVRGLIQHTALEAGRFDGPDYIFGWGLANIEGAAMTISNTSNNSIIEENALRNGEIYRKEIEVTNNSEPLIVSISWTDPAGRHNDEEIVDTDFKSLVNDLDVRVTDEEGKTYYPWKLDAIDFKSPAQQKDNDIDNFERIDIKDAEGKYTITVSHKNMLVDNVTSSTPSKQDYTLIVTGFNNTTSITQDKNLPYSEIYPVVKDKVIYMTITEPTNISLYELTGKLVSSKKMSKESNHLDVSDLKNGIYILKIENHHKQVKSYKIILN